MQSARSSASVSVRGTPSRPPTLSKIESISRRRKKNCPTLDPIVQRPAGFVDPGGMKSNEVISFGSVALSWLAEREEEYRSGELALPTWRSYRRTVAGLLVPMFGELPLDEFDISTFRELRKATVDIPARGNQALDLARRILVDAEQQGLRPAGRVPFRRVRRHPEMASSNPASPGAVRSVCEVCEAVLTGEVDVCHPHLAAMFKVIALTGARLSEIRDLGWSSVCLDEGRHGVLRLQQHKTVRRIGEKRIVLSARARKVIDWLDPEEPKDPRWVFPSHHKPWQPYRDVYKPWSRLVEYAGLDGLCIRDLRSGLATNAYDNGVPLEKIQEMLAHASLITTRRYTKISSRNVGKAYEVVEDAIFSSRTPQEGGHDD